MKHKIKIGNGAPCFITVDVGANHNKDIRTAKKLIDKAAEAGADAIKFQVYSAEKLYSKNVPLHSKFKKSLWQVIKEAEMPRQWIPLLRAYCDKKRIHFFATPFDMDAVDQLRPFVDLYKIASFELVDLPLIRYVAKQKKPMIISTGLATLEEIKEAYSACLSEGNGNVIFLQCASVYPARSETINLSAMDTIKHELGVVVGLSDHTLGIHVSVAAVAMGASVIEKHFTLDRKMKGPDHRFAIEPDELTEMVRQIRDVEKAFGNGRKGGAGPDELENYRIGRRSIHARRRIPKGEKITEDMLVIKRPGFGIKPKYIDALIAKKAKRQIEADEWITWKLVRS